MARGARNLQAVFSHPAVEVVRGDVKRREDLERAMTGADYVINLAHGGGGADFAAIRAAMVDTAVQVAEVAHAAGARRLVHVGSIAGLYLGDAGETVRDDTPPDPLPQTRNDYAHAKALADAAVKHGIVRADAYRMASQMVVGTGKLQLATGQHPAVMKDAVCSPGGTTIVGVGELERKRFRGAVIDAIDAIQDKK